MHFYLDYLQISRKSVHLQCVFHSIRFKVNKGWSTAVLLFLCPYAKCIRRAGCLFGYQPVNLDRRLRPGGPYHRTVIHNHSFFIHQQKVRNAVDA